MATWGPKTLVATVNDIAHDALLIPGIQRSFVWKPKQIETLFDSLLRDYPIGRLLLWQTVPNEHPNLKFRRLVTEAKGPNSNLPNSKANSYSRVFGVLDGQQRLTALNIALRGSYASSPNSTPRYLYFDLDSYVPDAGAEGNCYSFKFLPAGSEDGHWFRVANAAGIKADAASLNKALDKAGIERSLARRKMLKTLATALASPVIQADIVKTKDLDRVLNIFARANRGGTTLTYVDLLVSTATAQWKTLDAPAEIQKLRDRISSESGGQLDISIDRIVKAALVLLDAGSVNFDVDTFLRGRKARALEDQWPELSNALVVAAGTAAGFGLTTSNMSAQNALIPIAYYAFRRGLKTSYATAHVHEKDRYLVRAFLARTLLQRGYWTGAVDGTLVACRRVLQQSKEKRFPLEKIESALAGVKPITVTDALIDELCDLDYRDRRTLTLLALLFPHMTTGLGNGRLEKDHIFPISRFKLATAPPWCTNSDWPEIAAAADLLPNLQLLRAEDNKAPGKGSRLPEDWLSDLGPTVKKLYTQQFVKYLPADLSGCETFWVKRRDKLRTAITRLLVP